MSRFKPEDLYLEELPVNPYRHDRYDQPTLSEYSVSHPVTHWGFFLVSLTRVCAAVLAYRRVKFLFGQTS